MQRLLYFVLLMGLTLGSFADVFKENLGEECCALNFIDYYPPDKFQLKQVIDCVVMQPRFVGMKLLG